MVANSFVPNKTRIFRQSRFSRRHPRHNERGVVLYQCCGALAKTPPFGFCAGHFFLPCYNNNNNNMTLLGAGTGFSIGVASSEPATMNMSLGAYVVVVIIIIIVVQCLPLCGEARKTDANDSWVRLMIVVLHHDDPFHLQHTAPPIFSTPYSRTP